MFEAPPGRHQDGKFTQSFRFLHPSADTQYSAFAPTPLSPRTRKQPRSFLFMASRPQQRQWLAILCSPGSQLTELETLVALELLPPVARKAMYLAKQATDLSNASLAGTKAGSASSSRVPSASIRTQSDCVSIFPRRTRYPVLMSLVRSGQTSRCPYPD